MLWDISGPPLLCARWVPADHRRSSRWRAAPPWSRIRASRDTRTNRIVVAGVSVTASGGPDQGPLRPWRSGSDAPVDRDPRSGSTRW